MTTTTITSEDWAEGLLEIAATNIAELALREQRDPNFGDLLNTVEGLDEHSLSAVKKILHGGLYAWLETHRPQLLKGMKAAHAARHYDYATRLGNTASNLYLMARLGIPGEPPQDWTPPHFQYAYPLGKPYSGETIWKAWKELTTADVETVARFIRGKNADEFKEFALRIAPEMRDGETLLQVLERFGYRYSTA